MPEHNGVYHWFLGIHFLRVLTESDVGNLAAIGIDLETRVRWFNCPVFASTYPGDSHPEGSEQKSRLSEQLILAGFTTEEFELELKSNPDDNSNM